MTNELKAKEAKLKIKKLLNTIVKEEQRKDYNEELQAAFAQLIATMKESDQK